MALVAGVSLWIARYLGPGGFGVLNFASALVAVLLSVSTLGMDSTVILRLARDDADGKTMGSTLAIRAAAALGATLLCVLIAYFMRGDDAVAFKVCAVASLSILASVPYVLDYWFKARTEALAPAVARIVGTALGSAAKVACVVMGLGLTALASTLVLESLITGLGLVVAFIWSRRGQPKGLEFDRPTAHSIAKESLPFFISISAIAAYMKIDVVLLGFLETSRETGIYSLAQKISEVLYIVPVVLVDSAFPAIVRRFSGSVELTKSSAQLLFDVAAGGAFLATVLAIAIVKPLILALFGSSYGESVNIFYLHAWSSIAIALNYARYRWLAVSDLHRFAPIVTGIGLLTSTALNVLLIPRYGAIGAAAATVVSYFFSGYLLSFLIPSLRTIGHYQTRALWPWGRLYRVARDLVRPQVLSHRS
jgi:O-antigen/teichoic acid export membrane protein